MTVLGVRLAMSSKEGRRVTVDPGTARAVEVVTFQDPSATRKRQRPPPPDAAPAASAPGHAGKRARKAGRHCLSRVTVAISAMHDSAAHSSGTVAMRKTKSSSGRHCARSWSWVRHAAYVFFFFFAHVRLTVWPRWATAGALGMSKRERKQMEQERLQRLGAKACRACMPAAGPHCNAERLHTYNRRQKARKCRSRSCAAGGRSSSGGRHGRRRRCAQPRRDSIVTAV